jgi:hypothetical protein
MRADLRVWREARAMTRREVITKAIATLLSWVQAAEIIVIKPRQMRRIRWLVSTTGWNQESVACVRSIVF